MLDTHTIFGRINGCPFCYLFKLFLITLIVSTRQINYESGNVIVVPLSKNIKYQTGTRKLKYPYHFVLQKSKYPKLAFDSVVQCEDIRCVSKARLSTFVCNTDPKDMLQIKKRLKSALQI